MASQPKDLIGTRTIIFALLYIGLVAVLISWSAVHNDFSLTKAIEDNKLNALGDFLAGVFAPLALIGVGGAFFLQSKQLDLAIKQNDETTQRLLEQARADEKAAQLNYNSIQANYMLGLYDKRQSVFKKVVAAGRLYDAKIELKMIYTLQNALFDANFVFPAEVSDWIEEQMEIAERLRRLKMSMDDTERRSKQGFTITKQENDHYDEYSKEMQEKQLLLFKALLSEPLFERFAPYMKLPDTIDHSKR